VRLPPKRIVVGITGGPCGGKTMLFQSLNSNPSLAGRFVLINTDCFPFGGISPGEQRFQRLAVETPAKAETAAGVLRRILWP
jgi:hypothetical protein